MAEFWAGQQVASQPAPFPQPEPKNSSAPPLPQPERNPLVIPSLFAYLAVCVFVWDYSHGVPHRSVKSSGDHTAKRELPATGVGEIKAAGLSLNDLRAKIKKLMQKVPNSHNTFQIQITDFFSQKALLSISGKPGTEIKITNTPITLSSVLVQNGLSVDGNSIVQINLQRDSESYLFTLDDLLNIARPPIYLRSGDRIVADILQYEENKIFILGGVSPQIFKINPSKRETLADVLFTSGGALSASSAKRSEVYLLRGSNPVVAYHLDAQSPTRLIVADAMELRPNDILYVAEQPIMSFNRTLATITPLRILLRDIQDDNIP